MGIKASFGAIFIGKYLKIVNSEDTPVAAILQAALA